MTFLFAACAGAPRGEIRLEATSKKEEDKIQIEVQNERARIDIFSASGIGSADLKIISTTLPGKLFLRFHLQGLEELRFAYDETVVTATLSSTQEHRILQSLQRGKFAETQTITSESPYWMKLRVVAPPGERDTLPLRASYIEVEAPPDFLAGGHRRAFIHWIDFYR